MLIAQSVCDLVGCPRFGLRAGADVKTKTGPYCVKGWVVNASVNSFLSQKTCGLAANGTEIVATTLSGSCNDPDAKYTLCPNGGGDTQPLGSVASGPAAAYRKNSSVTADRI